MTLPEVRQSQEMWKFAQKQKWKPNLHRNTMFLRSLPQPGNPLSITGHIHRPTEKVHVEGEFMRPRTDNRSRRLAVQVTRERFRVDS